MPVMKGMKVKTNSLLTKKAREGMMEFLLVNHPLDCPICDQGGECDLQDQSLAFGSDRGRFTDNDYSGKRAVEDKDMGPLVKTVMTRCIQCTRCVRFANEVAGVDDLGTTGRGNEMQIGTYVDKFFASELSGNMIDLCPVGALTSRPYSFMARPWETRKVETVDVMDAVGSNIVLAHRTGEIMRVTPRLNDQKPLQEVNEEWISDTSRFAYDGLKNQRLVQPMIKNSKGELKAADWEEALFLTAQRLRQTKSDKIAAIAGPLSDAESLTALKDLLNKFDCENLFVEGAPLDSPLSSFVDFRSNYLMNDKITAIEDCDLLLLVGTNPRFEAPVINARIRKAFIHYELRAALLGTECDLKYDYDYLGSSSQTLDQLAEGKHPYWKVLEKAKRPLILIGSAMFDGSEGAAVLASAQKLASNLRHGGLKDAPKDWKVFNVLQRAASQVAALDLGYHCSGRALSIELLYLLGADGALLDAKLAEHAFVVYQGHTGDLGAQMADVILPAAAYTEKEGTYANTEGRAQQGYPAVSPPGVGRVDWKIMRALSEIAGRTLPYDTITQLRSRITQISPNLTRYGDVEDAGFADLALSMNQEAVSKGGRRKEIKMDMSELHEFYQPNVITRASPTMAKCVQAAKEHLTNTYLPDRKDRQKIAAV